MLFWITRLKAQFLLFVVGYEVPNPVLQSESKRAFEAVSSSTCALAAMRHTKTTIRDLPFWKRYPFEHEREFRIIYESREKVKTIDIPISPSSVPGHH